MKTSKAQKRANEKYKNTHSNKVKKYNKMYRAMHKNKRTLTNKDSRLVCRTRNQKFIYEYLLTHPCIDCGVSDTRCLEFDHIVKTTKKYKIAEMLTQGLSLETIITEIKKCEVRCANCHRIKTLKENKSPRYLWRDL